jgi:hypothetical protein
VRPHVAGERVDQHRRDGRIGEAALELERHDPAAVPLAEILRLADPDVDRA